jgi:hypothetical protein
MLLFFMVRCSPPTRSLWQVLVLAGTAGFGSAIGAHPMVGYNDPVHLAPAVLGAVAYTTGMMLCRAMCHNASHRAVHQRWPGEAVNRRRSLGSLTAADSRRAHGSAR